MSKTLTISLSEDGLHFEAHLPGNDRGHAIRVPIDMRGVAFLRHLLQERAEASDARIATPATPVQDMVEEYIRKGGAIQKLSTDRRAAREEMVHKAILDAIGNLTDEDFDEIDL